VFEIRPLVREQLNRENGADAQRLVPWPLLNAPFEASWCVVPAGGATGRDQHHEYELIIAMTGEAQVVTDTERQPFRAGDIVHFPPYSEHWVENAGTEDFQMYCIWWDTAMTEVFQDRHEQSQQA
jgi:mannose-6-phosphate isomerase-like protein (cupin superfamily)